jgi:hypothetical protein
MDIRNSLSHVYKNESDLVDNKVDLVELNGLESLDPRLAYEIASSSDVLFDAQPFLDSAKNALGVRIQSGTFARPIHA